MRKLTNKEFINKSIKIHGCKYNYSLVDYKNNSTLVKIICYKHGIFEQIPNSHLLKRGCRKCANENRNNHSKKTTEQIILDFNKTHNNKYDYSLVNYNSYHEKVSIICHKHGVFLQRCSDHINGSGCPKCGRILIDKYSRDNPTTWTLSNWDKASKASKNFDSFKVYIIKCYNKNESFYKIGRTFTTTKYRFKSKSSMPYDYEIVKELIFDNAKDAFNKEVQLKKQNKQNKYIPNIFFKGSKECFFDVSFEL